MGRQIIKQPNGKYCIFSSIEDNVTHYNMEEADIITLWANESKESIERIVKTTISALDVGAKPYYQFTLTYDAMLKTITEIHSSEAMNEIKSLIEK